jgi:hypothetical protein
METAYFSNGLTIEMSADDARSAGRCLKTSRGYHEAETA